MSLYLKYRPQDFQSVVGQEHAKRTLQSALAAGTMSHAYLFSGARGTGKTSLARIVAKSLNCLDVQDNEPCNQCQICTAINSGRLVDVIEIDAASNRGIDEIRELKEKIMFAPTQAKAKVYIIDEVHMLTKEAFNALLKTLEEPPSHSYFILATTESHKIPETIISRTQQFSFSRIGLADITGRLKDIAKTEGVEVDEPALSLIAKLSNGGLRDAIGLLEQMMTSGLVSLEAINQHLGLMGVDHLEKFFNSLLNNKPLEALSIVNSIKSNGASLTQFTKDAISYMRDQMLISLEDDKKLQRCMLFIDLFIKAKQQIDLSPIPELPIEMAILKACDFNSEPVAGDKTETLPSKDQTKEMAQTPILKVSPAIDNKTLQSPIELTLERIKKDWPRVLEGVKTPVLKMSLMNGQLAAYEDETLTLAFNSSTYMEKIDSLGHLQEVTAAFENVYKTKIKLKLELRKIDVTIHSSEKSSSSHNSAVDMAAEVFGISS